MSLLRTRYALQRADGLWFTHPNTTSNQWCTEDALEFVQLLLNAPIPHIALENPVGIISTRIRKPDCIIQPWQFGHPEAKRTCLWLKGLPALQPTNILSKPTNGRWENQTPSGQNKLAPGKDRWKERSKTYKGIADAMAIQWAPLLLNSVAAVLPLSRVGVMPQVRAAA